MGSCVLHDTGVARVNHTRSSLARNFPQKCFVLLPWVWEFFAFHRVIVSFVQHVLLVVILCQVSKCSNLIVSVSVRDSLFLRVLKEECLVPNYSFLDPFLFTVQVLSVIGKTDQSRAWKAKPSSIQPVCIWHRPRLLDLVRCWPQTTLQAFEEQCLPLCLQHSTLSRNTF